MIETFSIDRSASTVGPADEYGLLGANRVAATTKKQWLGGETPDAIAVLTSHPELRHYRSVVLDLAYTEYRLRLKQGEPLDAEMFSQRFPSLRRSLQLLIEVHGLLSQNPEFQFLEENTPWPEAGDEFLQFNLIAEIGRGAFGRVFLATEPALGNRQVVVKAAPHADGEADTLGKLRHPNIVPVYSLQEDEATGLAAFCMPYLGRATLADLLDHAVDAGCPPLRASEILDAIAVANHDFEPQESPPPASILRRGCYVDGVVHLAGQMADALAHSHERGICHRDLKPSNVLLAPEGRPLLLDFNLSIDAEIPTWKIGGTLPYMAPEELEGLIRTEEGSRPRHYDPRSDIFSLGVIIYELLTGKLPFGTIPQDRPTREVARLLCEQQTKGPTPIQELNRQVDSRLARLVEDCLAFECDRRPKTARLMTAAIRRELTIVRRGHRWIGNHRGLVSGVGVGILLMMLAAFAYLMFRPSYGNRQFQLGMHELERGEYASAVEYLNNAVRAVPNSSEVLFARGRAYQREGRFQLAQQDYYAAFQLSPSATHKACEGYCLSKTKYHREAIAAYRVSLDGGYASPAILENNSGFCYLALGQVDRAEECLERAIYLDGSMQAAHLNMVRVFLMRAMRGQPIPKIAFFHATRAIETGSHSADLFHCVAALHAVGAKHDPTLVQAAIEYVKKAVQLGDRPEAIASDAAFSVLKNEAAFQNAMKNTLATVESPKSIQLIDPLDHL